METSGTHRAAAGVGRSGWTRRGFLKTLLGASATLLAACAPAAPAPTTAPATGGGQAQPAAPAAKAGAQPTPIPTVAPAAKAAAPATAAPKTAARKTGGSLRVGVPLDAISLDPYDATQPSTRQIYDNIYETLVELDFDGKLQPALAEKWEQMSPTAWRFTIRKGVKFHSGNPCDPAAIKAHYDRILDPQKPGRPASTLAPVSALRVEGDTLIVETKEPNATVPILMSHPTNSVADTAQVQKLGKDYAANPSGTGPFKFKAWQKEQSITLVKNPDYWRGAPPLDEVVFRVIPEDNTRALAFQNNEIDVFYSPPGHLLSQFKNDKNTQVVTEISYRTVYVGLNALREPLQDVKVRTALAHAVNTKALADFVLEGIGVPAEGFVSPKVWGFAKVGLWEFNPDQTKQLLAEAGWKPGAGGIYEKDGKPLKIGLWTSPEDPKNEQIAEALQAELKKVGFDVEVQKFELAAFVEQLKKMEHHAYIYGSTAGTGDIDHQMNLNFLDMKKDPPPNRNYMGLKNEAINAATADGRAESNETKRAEIYRKAQEILKQEVPWIPLYHAVELAAARQYVKDFRLHAAQNLWFANVWLDK